MRRILFLVALIGAAAITTGCDGDKGKTTNTPVAVTVGTPAAK